MARLALGYSPNDGEQSEAIQLFRFGLAHLRDGQSFEALAAFRQAASMEPQNPYFLSYYGLALGQASRNWDEAEALCLAALRLRRQIPQLHLNLADLYRRRGRVADAVETLHDALRYTGRDARVTEALAHFGQRKAPVFSFLGRNHPLNRYLGRVRHRASGILRKKY
ncbi:MAG TPA: tetratricopeptide repeat protein [Candidatus Acidoferrales bacterium]|nr:tetratricopeptide repeat protein [Candidatus Acidoferrales bacterium]